MINQNDTELVNRMKKRIIHRLYVQTVWRVFVMCTFLLVAFVMGKAVCAQVVWNGSEPLYKLLKLLDDYMFCIIPFLICFGTIIFLIPACRRMFDYLYEVVEATSQIYSNDDDMIVLSPDMEEVAGQMNKIKMQMRHDQYAAREAEQRKNDLVVYLAHDLKTPLTSVIGYLTLLDEEKKISPELQEKYLGIALDKAERLEDLINEFFEITRFNLTTLELEYSQINLTRMLEQITNEFRPMFMEKNLTCQLDIPGKLMIRCDVDKMERVFDNLLRNAVNYSYPDTTIQVKVDIKSNEDIAIRFINHGNTIPEEKLSRIFEQFYRLDSARTSRSGGAGLGLAIAKQIVELHGGSISAQSENDSVEFSILLRRNFVGISEEK